MVLCDAGLACQALRAGPEEPATTPVMKAVLTQHFGGNWAEALVAAVNHEGICFASHVHIASFISQTSVAYAACLASSAGHPPSMSACPALELIHAIHLRLGAAAPRIAGTCRWCPYGAAPWPLRLVHAFAFFSKSSREVGRATAVPRAVPAQTLKQMTKTSASLAAVTAGNKNV
ncbi:hypothetical protein HaLaN_11150 [Haematococcus lacustris]|uniref:Uncharacterized protein n=1 Tax=Haematococcus lacustris TaxID=44745 RepID=A0A699YZ78_HAELA|nr:hypothetical protein HaLaN_11150 [Haematococcus lacustris]